MKLTGCSRFAGITATSLLLLMCMSCATFFNGTTQNITFHSNRNGLYITVLDESGKNVFSGRTPCKASLERGAGYFKPGVYTVYYEERPGEGKERYQRMIRGDMDVVWYLLMDFAFAQIILGWFIIDPSTGAMWVLSPDYIRIDLHEQESDNTVHGS